ncbi:LpxL/LpxP family acyltransferase [Bordetella genomosp. 10]|uniref:LpxL/LpxP family acyltransferase n=1 Tax=Bordetella genomosp. 10 TaxID=1416804 RepID=UPI00117770A0|nr:glycosyl transferase [Bordetella genomosp. 10]
MNVQHKTGGEARDDARNEPRRGHWAAQRERGVSPLLNLTAWAARTLGRRTVRPLVVLIVLYFFCFAPRARRAIADYQQRLRARGLAGALPARRPVFGQFMAFADALLDKLDVWQGRLTAADVTVLDPHGLHAQMDGRRGQILVCAHIGNLDVCRALVERSGALALNVLVHTRHAQAFNRLLERHGASRLRLYQVTELDPATMLDLHRRIEAGEWLAIAGDRVPVHGQRVATADFLGAPAPFPQGPWLLAGLLRCPVNLLFCTKIGGRYRIAMERLTEGIAWSRGGRDAAIGQAAQRYADRLARECADAPQQWFNFYPFWSDHA